MPSIPGISHRRAVAALRKAGFVVIRESGHTVMRRGDQRITLPRHNPIDSFTMGGIAKDAGLTPEEFRALL